MEKTDRRPRGLGKRARITTWILRRLLHFLGWIKFVNVTVINNSVVPKKGAIILAANHTSMLDILFIGAAVRRPIVALGAKEQIDRPVVRHFARLLGQIPVIRKDKESGARARTAVLHALEWAAAFVIFPQGKIARPGEYVPLRPGVADFAMESGALVYPVYIDGANRVMPLKADRPGKKRLYRDQKVTVIFGEPISPSDYASREELLLAVERAIFALAPSQ